MIKKILTIAGSDPSGGAGIQADLKTIAVHDMYGMSVITALTAQNTTGVFGISEVSAEFAALQLDCVFRDIRPDAVKIGMVSNPDIVRIVAEKLREYEAGNIVVDPVMVATSGGKLMRDSTAETLVRELFPLARVITPNIPEAEALCGMSIKTPDDVQKAAARIADLIPGTACAVLIKGGHLGETADDFLLDTDTARWFYGKRIATANTHGTGCTLSSAVACRLAEGRSAEESVLLAKEYVTGAIASGLDLGHGNGPLDHTYSIR